jgi:CelD/BcsL family acetyltransferase involved in cellulose biosynthesis
MSSATGLPAPRGEIHIEWVSDARELERLEPAWRALEDAVPHRTHVSTFDFLYPWYRHYAGDYGGTPLVGLAWAGHDLVGIAPLALRRGTLGRVPVTRVDFAPTDSIAGEFLVHEDRCDVVSRFLESLAARAGFDIACLNGFERTSRFLPVLQDAAGRHRLSIEVEDHAYAMVDLRQGYQPYWRRLKGDIRRKLNHRARKIGALGAAVDGVVPDSVVPDGVGDTMARVGRIIAITEASYKLRGERLADHHRAFLTELIERLAQRGKLSLPILTIGGRDAAFILGVVERGCLYDITLSYDESFAALGPGMFLMQETLKQCAEAGIHTVVSHGAHEYKRTWSTRFVPQTRLYLFRRRPRAIAARVMRFGLQPLWRRLGAFPVGGHAAAPIR